MEQVEKRQEAASNNNVDCGSLILYFPQGNSGRGLTGCSCVDQEVQRNGDQVTHYHRYNGGYRERQRGLGSCGTVPLVELWLYGALLPLCSPLVCTPQRRLCFSLAAPNNILILPHQPFASLPDYSRTSRPTCCHLIPNILSRTNIPTYLLLASYSPLVSYHIFLPFFPFFTKTSEKKVARNEVKIVTL